MKICFATDVNYPNYTKRIQESALKNFLDKKLYQYDISYYISTNRPKDLEKHNNINNVKIFDINVLRRSHEYSSKYELLPEDPTGIYPSKYPWNLRRFIIEQAAKDGFDYIIYVDGDMVLVGDLNGQDIYEELRLKYSPNVVKTNAHIFEYSEDSTSEVFEFHDKYKNYFNLQFDNRKFNTVDGPCMVFMGETSDDIINLVKTWHFFTEFGYKKEFGFGYQNNFIANLSFCIPLSNFELLGEHFPFQPNHILEDRYDSNYVAKPNEFVYNDNIHLGNNEENIENTHNINFDTILNNYSCRKYHNGFAKIVEKFLISITDTNPNILEIGVGSIDLEPPIGRHHVPESMYNWKQNNPNYLPGNSLRALRDFLKTGWVYGVDIQKDCLFEENRITTCIFDSRNPKKMYDFILDKKFDLIIDDSDKDPNVRILTFMNLYESLKEHGYYVIEDVLDVEFIMEYFSHKEIPYIISNNFMIINKKNNFELLTQVINKVPDSNVALKTTVKYESNYENMINNSPKFSIGECLLADKGFYINLESSTERKTNVDNMIEKYNIKGLLRFEALKDDMIQFACTKSHLEVFKTCLNNGIDSVFVAEDDFQIEDELYQPNAPKVYFQNKINAINEDLNNLEWDVFLFGCNPKTHLVPLTNNVAIVNKSTGAWAYIIKKRAYQFLIDNLNYKRDYIAIDDYLPILNDNGFTTLTSIPMTIGHAVGFVSTLQPRGPVNYTDWIRGNYHKFLFDNYPDNNYDGNKIEKQLTLCVTGDFSNDYLIKLRYCLKFLPKELRKCKFIVKLDSLSEDRNVYEYLNLQAYFRDVRSDLNVTMSYGENDTFLNLKYFLDIVKTPYFLVFNIDDVFQENENLDFNKIIKYFNDYDFINSIFFPSENLFTSNLDMINDKNNYRNTFDLEKRVDGINLITLGNWKNNVSIHRVKYFMEILNRVDINNSDKNFDIGKLISPMYVRDVLENTWDFVKNKWGCYFLGNISNTIYVKKFNIYEKNKLTEND